MAKATPTASVPKEFIPRKRRLIFVRHGQRLDRYVNEAYNSIRKEWVQLNFDGNVYKPFNLEFPLNLPVRSPIIAYHDDPPVTTMGEMCAQILGNRIAEIGIDIDLVYSSPSFRCVQTATRVLQGYKDCTGRDLKIRLDGNLYEFGGVDSNQIMFQSPEYFADRGCPIDLDYKNTLPDEELKHHLWESFDVFRQRGKEWISDAFSTLGNDVDTVLIVSHASAIMSYVRILLNKPFSRDSLDAVVNLPPTLTTLMLEEAPQGKKWSLIQPQPLPSFTIRGNSSFCPASWLNKVTYESPRISESDVNIKKENN